MMDTKSDGLSAILVDVDDMETIQLHRAESMAESSIDFIKPEQSVSQKKPDQIYSTISSKARILFEELKDLKLEVIMFLYMFSYIMRSISSTTMIMDKVCLVHLQQPQNVCIHLNLEEHNKTKSEVEKLANNYQVAHSLIQMLPSSIIACFLGAWSDKYSRKIPLIIALLGIILDGLGTTLCAAFFYSRVEYYFIPGFFTGISGGFIGVLTVLYSYAADITTFSKRTMKYALMEVSFGLAMPLGQLAGGWLYKFSGYVPVFMVSTAGHLLGLAWVLFVLKETKGLDSTESWGAKFKKFWSLQPLLDSVKATVKKRPNQGRKQIILLILSMSIAVLSFVATAGIGFLYVHHVYNWDNTQYSTVSAVFSVIGTLNLLIIVPLFKRFNLGDATLGIVGTTSMSAKFLGMGLASKAWVYFAAHLLGIFGGLATLAGRSRISKVSSKSDLGKIFSFLTAAESLLPIMATTVVSQVYNATLDFYPGMIYLGLAALLLVPLAIFFWLSRLPVVDYEEMHNNPQGEDELTSNANSNESPKSKF